MASKKRKKKSRRRAVRGGAHPKMSAVILELADPMLKQFGNAPDLTRNIITITIAAWNRAVLPANLQAGFEQKVLEALGPVAGGKNGREVVTSIMEFVAEQRKRYYPHLRSYIVNFDVSESEGQISLDVASTTLKTEGQDDVGEPRQAD